jgi:hypothetical protein
MSPPTRGRGLKPPGFTIDHENRNGLDNRLSNLRLATIKQQGFNKTATVRSTTGYKGVCFNKRSRKFTAMIRCYPERRFLGYFVTAEEAAVAYNKAAIELHGEFARLNVIPDESNP